MRWHSPRPIMVIRRMIVFTFVTASLAIAGESPSATQPATPTIPNPQLRPQEVVRIVVEALGHNDANDAGIRTTWNFASPGNKQITGSLERFIPMVKNPGYAPLLHYRKVEYGMVRASDTQAAEVVMLIGADGRRTWFLFRLSRQADGPLKGCWMTDGVLPVRPRRDAAPPATQPAAPAPPPAERQPDDSLPV